MGLAYSMKPTQSVLHSPFPLVRDSRRGLFPWSFGDGLRSADFLLLFLFITFTHSFFLHPICSFLLEFSLIIDHSSCWWSFAVSFLLSV